MSVMASQPVAQELRERALRVMVGGVTAGGRFDTILGRSYYFERGDGCYLWDVDGNRYIDFSSSNGASMLGFNHPRINEAVREGLALGTMCSQETKYHVELCERLTQIIPSAEKVRLSNTGTEATMAAIRIARAATGRERVLKFEGHFHGMHDYVFYNCHTPLDRPYEAVVPPYPDSDGIPKVIGDLLVNVPFNDERALLTALDEHADEIACVILEPVSYNLGCVVADRDWLRLLRAETERRGIVLIFDEVLCGFRMALGGAEEYLGVTPDLSTWAKALAAGWPLAAITGKAAVMDVLNPTGHTVMSGTYSGQLCSVMAALAALDVMSEPGFYERIGVVSDRLYRGLDRLLAENGVPGHVQGLGARFCIYFGMSEWATDYRTACQFDAGLSKRFLAGCAPAGLHCHDFGAKEAPMHYGITSAHTEAIVDEALDRMQPIFRTLSEDTRHLI